MKENFEKELLDDYVEGKLATEVIRKKYDIGRKEFDKLINTKLSKKVLEDRRKIKIKLIPPKHINLIGTKINHITILKLEKTKKSKDKSYRGIGVCDCGEAVDINIRLLLKNKIKSCGNKECNYYKLYYNKSGERSQYYKGYKEISGTKWNHIRNGAIKRNLEFSITIDYAWDLFITQNRKCKLSDKDIFFGKTNTKETTASLDRIDSNKGYVYGNIQWVHKIVNFMKQNLSDSDFISICKEIVLKNSNDLSS